MLLHLVELGPLVVRSDESMLTQLAPVSEDLEEEEGKKYFFLGWHCYCYLAISLLTEQRREISAQ